MVVSRNVGHAKMGPADAKANRCYHEGWGGGNGELCVHSVGWGHFTLANDDLKTEGATKPSMPLGSALTLVKNGTE